MSAPHEMDALSAAAEIAAGRLTSEYLVRSCLERIEARDGAVRAWEFLDPEMALAEAVRRDAEEPRSPLHGVPVGVKDIVATHDMPTANGSPIYAGHRPAWDAACVALLRAAGMVVLGKTVTTEFAMRHPGKTRNPHDPGHTPGGSSSGSAAAVADGMVPLAIGTQTAGSVIRPASYCGCVGFKPTYGRIARAGVKMLGESLDTIGCMARSVPDAAAFAAVMEGVPIAPFEPRTSPPRVAYCRTPAWPDAEPELEPAMLEGLERLRSAGAQIVERELPKSFDEAGDAHTVVMSYEGYRSLAWEFLEQPEKLSQAIKDYTGPGRDIARERYDWARRVQAACRAEFYQMFLGIDVVLTPAAPGEAPAGLAFTGSPVFNRIWTLLGVPCVTVPGLKGPRGLPIGLQVVGPAGHAAAALAAAAWIHTALAR
ncbi:MAG: amidase [Alphaproteobacteria bacterium]